MSYGLPESRNVDGRPIWEPPILDYFHLIDTEHAQSYTKQREAVLAFTGQDVARATAILDQHEESELLNDFIEWAKLNDGATADPRAQTFWQGLRDNLRVELLQVLVDDAGELGGTGWATFEESEDGPWKMEQPEEWEYYDSDFEEEYGEDSDGDESRSSALQDSAATSSPTLASNRYSRLQISASLGLHHLGLHQIGHSSSQHSALNILMPHNIKLEADLD